MTRPTYQTPEHLRRQEDIAEYIAARFGCSMQLIPRRYSFADYLATFPDGRRVVVEVKDRPSVEWGEPVPVSVTKMMDLTLFASTFDRVRAVFAIRTGCGTVGWTYVSDIGDDLFVGGRYDRNDPDDIELMVSIPASRFRRIGKMEVER